MKGFEYQLIKYMSHEADLLPFLLPFKKYKEEDKRIIVNNENGWTLFTKGNLIFDIRIENRRSHRR